MSEVLRAEMKKRRVKGRELCVVLDISESEFSRKLNGKKDWTLGECYAALDYLSIPQSHFCEVFPNRKEMKQCFV